MVCRCRGSASLIPSASASATASWSASFHVWKSLPCNHSRLSKCLYRSAEVTAEFPAGLRAVLEHELQMVDGLARSRMTSKPCFSASRNHAVAPGEVGFVGRREIVGFLKGKQPVVGAAVGAAARARSAEQVDPHRIETVALTIGEEQFGVFLRQVHHERRGDSP